MTERSQSAEFVKEAFRRGYRVREDGQLLNPQGVALNGNWQKASRGDGYYQSMSLPVGGRSKRVFVHQLHAYQLYGDAALAEGIHTRHLNGNSRDNSAKNIAIGSAHDNSMDRPESTRTKHAKVAAGASRRWTTEQVRELRRRYFNGTRAKLLVAEEGVSKGTMSMMLNRKTYRDVE